MLMRQIKIQDIPQLVELDKKAYGQYGADEKYFRQKLNSQKTKILVIENKKQLTGFVVFEFMKENEIPKDFTDLVIDNPLKSKWVHIIAFTTQSNYENRQEDTKLLKFVEELSKKLGYFIFAVPLSINHPYLKAYSFFEQNGYLKTGTIKWIADNKDKINCYFYLKSAS